MWCGGISRRCSWTINGWAAERRFWGGRTGVSRGMTTASSTLREGVWQRRRWCREGQTHQDEDDPWCGWYHDMKPTHRLRIRKMLICQECEQGYFSQETFDGHQCFSAYEGRCG